MRTFYLFILLIGLTLYLVLATSAGVRLTYYALQYALPGKLTIQQLEGKLLSHVNLSHLHYQTEELDVNIEKVYLNWNIKDLLATRINILHLNADNVNIKTTFQQTSSATFDFASFITYLKHIKINEAVITHFNLDTPSLKKLTLPLIQLVEITPLQYHANLQFEQGNIDSQFIFYKKNGINWLAKINANRFSLNYSNMMLENISFNSLIEGNYHQELKKLHLLVDNIGGKVNSHSLNGLVDLIYDNHLKIKQFNIYLGPAKLIANGYVNTKWNITYQLSIPQLAVLFPAIKSGSIDSYGTIEGAFKEPSIASKTEVKNINSDIAIIPQANLTINGKLSPTSPLKIDMSSHDFSIMDYKVKSAQASILVNKSDSGFEVHLMHGQFNVPVVNLLVSNIDINANIKNNELIAWKGTLTAGHGSAAFQGKTSLVPDAALQTNLSLVGSRLAIANLPHLSIVVSPTLNLNYEHNTLTTKGDIYIPSARIVRLTNNKVVNLSNDVVYVKNKNELPSLKIANDIKIVLGDKIELDYQNIKTQVVGSVHLMQPPGGQLTATGTLNTKNGTYKAYEKDLKINVGKIIYVGNSLLNPGLDIEATRTINRLGNNTADFITDNHITVGIKVNGTLNQPTLTLISHPTMSQNNILSYLLFDTPASQLSPSSTITLMNMAVAIKNGGATSSPGTLNKIQEKIDKMGISVGSTAVYDPTSDASKTTSTVGISKKIGRDVTISYHTNPFNNLAVFGLHYQLNKYFVLRTQASNLETTTDIIYEIEKDE